MTNSKLDKLGKQVRNGTVAVPAPDLDARRKVGIYH